MMIKDSDPVDGEARCPHCGAKVLETSYACPNCGQVVRWMRKPDEEEAEESAADVCECGHLRSEHILRGQVSLCIKPGCSCMAFTPPPTTFTDWRPTTRRGH